MRGNTRGEETPDEKKPRRDEREQTREENNNNQTLHYNGWGRALTSYIEM